MVRGDLVRVLARLRLTRGVSLKAIGLASRKPLAEADTRLPVFKKSRREEEFSNPAQTNVDRFLRKLERQSQSSASVAAIAQPKLTSALINTGIGISVIFLLGNVEGQLWLARPVDLVDSLRFSVTYAAMNLIPSFTWNSVDPTVVLQALSPSIGDVDTMLYDFSLLHDAAHAADEAFKPAEAEAEALEAVAAADHLPTSRDPTLQPPEPDGSAPQQGRRGWFSWLVGSAPEPAPASAPPLAPVVEAADAFVPPAPEPHLVHGPVNATPSDPHAVTSAAIQRAEIAWLASLRGTVSTVVVLSQLLQAFSNQLRAEEARRERLLQGKERILPTMSGREIILRLCGAQSETTHLALQRYGEHILPVFENARLVSEIIWDRSRQGSLPCWWLVKPYRYASRESWTGMGVTEEWLLRTSTGKKLLYVEADGTIPAGDAHESISSRLLAQNDMDLEVDEAVQGFRAFEHHAKKQIIENIRQRLGGDVANKSYCPAMRTVRVLLADSSQYMRVGGEHRQTVRERLLDRGDVEVVIDSTMPVLDALVQWCRRITAPQLKRIREEREEDPWLEQAPPMRPKVIFETSMDDHFATFRDFIGKICDVDVISPSDEADMTQYRKQLHDDNLVFPRIIYYNSTATTTTTLQNLATRKPGSLKSSCVMFESVEGVDIVDDLEEQYGVHIESICSAVIYDDLYGAVRSWTRAGHSAAEIQTELDTRYGYLWPILTFRKTGASDEQDIVIQ